MRTRDLHLVHDFRESQALKAMEYTAVLRMILRNMNKEESGW
jgi:hypothetical protein